MTDQSYNGWTNRETWAFGLWHDFDAEEIVQFYDLESDKIDVYELSKYLEDWTEEMYGHYVENLPGFLKDILVLESINWYEIAENLADAHIDECRELSE